MATMSSTSQHELTPRAKLVPKDVTPSYICSLSFDSDGKRLAAGDSRGIIYLSDVETGKVLASEKAHLARIGSLHWQEDRLVSGSKDKTIKIFDLRQPFLIPITDFCGHMQEICGLKMSPNGNQLASGGNDNQLNLWDIRQMRPLAVLGTHEAAVKAIAWHPKHAGVLSSGAGTADRKIRTFNTNRLEQVSETDTGSQVCNLVYDPDGEFLISTHGYSLNQMILWDIKEEMKKADCVIAHKLRVLYLSNSPCGKYVVTGAGDESMRIWKINKPVKYVNKAKSIFAADVMKFR